MIGPLWEGNQIERYREKSFKIYWNSIKSKRAETCVKHRFDKTIWFPREKRGHKGGIMRCPLNLAMFITGDLQAWVESSDRYMKQPNLQVTRWISIKWCTCLHSSIPMIKMVCFIFLIMIYLSVLNTRLSLILKIGYPTGIIVKLSSFRAGNAIWNYIWYQR